MSSRFVLIAVLYACLGLCTQMHAQSPSPSEVKNLSPDKKWEYDCPQSVEYECAPEVVKAGTNETVVDLDGDLNVYIRFALRSKIYFWLQLLLSTLLLGLIIFGHAGRNHSGMSVPGLASTCCSRLFIFLLRRTDVQASFSQDTTLKI